MSDISVIINNEIIEVAEVDNEIEISFPTGNGIIDHGLLTGLSDNDHSQYLLATALPTRVFGGAFSDVTLPSAGVTGYAFLWNHATQMAVWTLVEAAGAASAAVAAHVAQSDPHAQYQLESGLGTAAFINVGTGASQVVQLNASSQLPAVDGSLLTNLPGGGGGSPGGSTTQVQYNNAGVFAGHSGFIYNGAGYATLSTGLVVPLIRPASDSTTAVKFTKADGATTIAAVDTTNGRLLIYGNGIVPSAPITAPVVIQIDATGRAFVLSNSSTEYTDFVSGGVLKGMRGTGTVPFVISNTGSIYFNPGGSYDLYIQYSTTEYFRFTSAGRLACGHNATASAVLDLAASTTARASLRIRDGTAPTTPNNGDVWYPTGGRLSLYRTATEIFATGVQATGGAATAGVLYTATEQTMLQKCYDACRAFGLLN